MLAKPDFKWKGPSWNCFLHAAFNERPMTLITARGHHPDTLRTGMEILQRYGHLPAMPNWLGVYPVSHPQVRRDLGDSSQSATVSQLKKSAILASVESAMVQFGCNPHHRFGMSDDSPENLELIVDAMRIMKGRYPQNRFFVIDTHQERFVKQEIFLDSLRTSDAGSNATPPDQLELF